MNKTVKVLATILAIGVGSAGYVASAEAAMTKGDKMTKMKKMKKHGGMKKKMDKMHK